MLAGLLAEGIYVGGGVILFLAIVVVLVLIFR